MNTLNSKIDALSFTIQAICPMKGIKDFTHPPMLEAAPQGHKLLPTCNNMFEVRTTQVIELLISLLLALCSCKSHMVCLLLRSYRTLIFFSF